MKIKLNYGLMRGALKENKSRLSLTLLFAGAVFLILLSVLAVVSAFALILVNTGAIPKNELGIVWGNKFILLMIAASFIIGAAFAFLFGRLFMRPINEIINMMNRLAAGDYKARIYIEGVFRNHPALSELTDSVNKLAAELENTEMLSSDFVNNFSHEFKTPIVSIAGFAKLLKSGGLSEEEQRDYINIIEEESMRLSDMATSVLNLTKIENQNILTGITHYNLSEQVRTCLLLLEKKWSDKDIDFSLDFDEYFITGNEDLLKQVWLNLLDNAIKFTPSGGKITVAIEKNAETLSVSVENTGSFIPRDERDRIFRKFYQSDTSHAGSGNGIGLAVVKRITELHGGDVEVTSGDNTTKFTVTLPLAEN